MKADLHVHTMYSLDGKTTMEELIDASIANGIGCVAVTDHNEFQAFEQVKDNGRVIVIPAEEVSSKNGHIIALGINRHIPRGLSIPSANRKSERLAKKIGKPITAGSDAHLPGGIGAGYIEIPDSISNWQEAVDYIMSGKVSEAKSHSRHMDGTLHYGFKSIGEWMLRGFKKM